jgi:peptidoglycan/xylan/chitin deacetylase (PgdA/CDA1 family)
MIAKLFSKLEGRGQRSAARLFGVRPFLMRRGAPIISFSFDDFPRSAILIAGPILQKFGFSGTYYTSLGLAGRGVTPVGEIFQPEDLDAVLKQGHELGCHTFSHCHAWDTAPALFEASVVENRETLKRLHPHLKFASLSYPIGTPRPATKRRMAKYFGCCRGGGQTFNTGKIDLNLLSAYFLEQSRDNPDKIKAAIDESNRSGGWLIFATHDVCADATRFGCTPALFEEVVRYAAGSGATILPVSQAWETIRLRNQ